MCSAESDGKFEQKSTQPAKAVKHLLDLLQLIMRDFHIWRIASHALEILAVFLQVAGDILSCHAFHIHQLQDGLRHCILDALHPKAFI